jgi:LPXTG-motif cell wall-anchored protein
LEHEQPAEPRAVRSSREDDQADEPRVVAAANGAVTITDFEFTPTTVNVNVGDSVTWLNRGPTVHTATASDGSFDSGNMSRGKSYSHKFTKAGTYNYICTPHPFMKASVTVQAADSGAGGEGGSAGGVDTSGGAGAGDTGASAADADEGSGLPATGRDSGTLLVLGLLMLALGLAVHRRARTV